MARERTVRVLLVEDNPQDVEIVRRMLGRYRRANFEVDSVGSTEECLERLKGSAFDLVLLDYGLPGEDGMAFLRRVAGNADVPPAIMLTGQGDERVATEAMRCGAYDYIPKDGISSEVLAHAIHQALEKYRLSERLDGAEQVIFALAAAVEAKDPTTEGHLHRMAHYAARLGQALGLDEHQLMLLMYGAILHDVGKIGVSRAILCKPGPLSGPEWEEMHLHPIVGERICAPLRFSHEVGAIIRHHHERWDGTGYVDSLSGEEIPFLARLVSVVDAFDAMCSDRPYRKALPFDETLRRLSDGAGVQWDRHITRVFVDLVRREGFGRKAGRGKANGPGDNSRPLGGGQPTGRADRAADALQVQARQSLDRVAGAPNSSRKSQLDLPRTRGDRHDPCNILPLSGVPPIECFDPRMRGVG